MGIFKKERGVEVLDFTLLRKKGLIKVHPIRHSKKIVLDSSGMLDLTASLYSNSKELSPIMPSNLGPSAQNFESSIDNNPFGMLDSLAKASSTPQVDNEYPFSVLDLSSANNTSVGINNSNSMAENSEINAMKIRIENLEFKIEQLMGKLDQFGATKL